MIDYKVIGKIILSGLPISIFSAILSFYLNNGVWWPAFIASMIVWLSLNLYSIYVGE